jgi:hypothetical protein
MNKAFVGILNEHENGLIKVGKPLNSYPKSNSETLDNLENIVNYLENGVLLIAFLHWVTDVENNPIAPMIIYTDGKWLWPSYLVHYLKEGYHSLLPDEFIEDMNHHTFNCANITQLEKEEVEQFYILNHDPKRFYRKRNAL